MLTPPIRYSKPGLQAHITCLYGRTNSADQKVGRDARERYAVLRKRRWEGRSRTGEGAGAG